jgi:HTH-type transcriptional regulator / antitoxin HigA
MAIEFTKYRSVMDLKPAIIVGPGDHIEEMLEENGWTQDDLAQILGFSAKHINQIITHKQSISFDIATALSKAFNHSTEFWINSDARYRLQKQANSSNSLNEIEQKKQIYTYFPVKEMSKRGWISHPDSLAYLKLELAAFQKSISLDFKVLETRNVPLFRKSEAFQAYNYYAAAAWFQRAKNISEEIKVPIFDKNALQNLVEKIAEFTILPNGIDLFLEKLTETGVIFFVLPHLQKTYLDGAAFWENENPTIVYTARLKRLDNFWFTVAHEIAHVLLHLEKGEFILDDDRFSDKDDAENEANEAASNWLKHPQIGNFALGMRYIHDKMIENAAENIGVHPSIVSGTLVHKKVLGGNRIHTFNQNPVDLLDEIFIKN